MPHFEANQPSDPPKPCRTCVDFKTWTKQQRNVYHTKSDVSDMNYCDIVNDLVRIGSMSRITHAVNFIVYRSNKKQSLKVRRDDLYTDVQLIKMNSADQRGIYYIPWPHNIPINHPTYKSSK